MSAATRRRRAPARRWILLLALGLFSGCGIPVDATARPLSSLPLNPPAPASSSGANRARIYYLQQGHLSAVTRDAAALTPATVLTLLIQEPSETETQKGISTALSPNDALEVGGSSTSSGVITVELPPSEFLNLTGSFLYEAYAQIVCTLTDPSNFPRVRGVSFELAEAAGLVPWRAYLPSFSTATKPVVTCEDYRQLQ